VLFLHLTNLTLLFGNELRKKKLTKQRLKLCIQTTKQYRRLRLLQDLLKLLVQLKSLFSLQKSHRNFKLVSANFQSPMS
jgi:hypothetical protein